MPPKLKYTEYLWIKQEGELLSVGVNENALKQIKEIVFIDLPKKGGISKGETLFSIESVKWSGHLASPVSGEVVEVNEPLFDEPERINSDPYGSWVCRIKPEKPEELDSLMDAKEMRALL